MWSDRPDVYASILTMIDDNDQSTGLHTPVEDQNTCIRFLNALSEYLLTR